MAPDYTPKQLQHARLTLQRAEAWRKRNADLYANFETWALNEAEYSRKFAVQEFAERVRSKDRVDAQGENVTVNNDFCAIFARWLCAEHPHVRPFVVLRRSVFDELLGVHHG